MNDRANIRLELNDGVAVITVDRPDVRNAMSRAAWQELREYLSGLRFDAAARGLIVTGSGEHAFVAGADIRELAERAPFDSLDALARDVLLDLEALPIPTIAAINGHALGGGWELALACDLRIAVSTARVGFPEVGLGILPGAGGTLRLLRHVGVGLAKEWILLGTILGAEEAQRHGLLNRVVGPGEVLPEAHRLMAQLMGQPPIAVRLATVLVDAAARGDATPDLERLAYTLTFHAPDRAERMHRFLDRNDRILRARRRRGGSLMEYRVLGGTGIRVSTLSLGTMMFGPWGNTDVDECVSIVHQALDAGINLVDTADMYSAGASEEIVGRAIAGRRDEVVLATKFHNPMGDGVNDRGNSRLWIMRAVEGSLRRLATDHIDLYQVHRAEEETAIEETLSALTDLQRAGTIRAFGTSAFPAWQIVEGQWVAERRGLERFRSEQPPYSIFTRHVEHDVLPVAEAYGMGVIVWAPLARGWLTGRYRRGGFDRSPASRASRSVGRGGPVEAQFDESRPEIQAKLDAVEQLVPVAEQTGISMTHMAMAFTLAHPAITSAIVGVRRLEQLQDILAGADQRLDADALDAIDAIVAPGTTLDQVDRGFSPWWLAPERRRRSA